MLLYVTCRSCPGSLCVRKMMCFQTAQSALKIFWYWNAHSCFEKEIFTIVYIVSDLYYLWMRPSETEGEESFQLIAKSPALFPKAAPPSWESWRIKQIFICHPTRQLSWDTDISSATRQEGAEHSVTLSAIKCSGMQNFYISWYYFFVWK